MYIFCIVYSLYEFVDEKVENKLKSNQSNQIKSKLLQKRFSTDLGSI